MSVVINYTDTKEIKRVIFSQKEKISEIIRCNNLLVITQEYEAIEKIGGKSVRFAPLWRWLLD